MRKLYSLKNFIVGACLMIAPMFVGCSDDDDDVPQHPDVPEEEPVYRFNQQEVLQGAIVKVDSLGNWVKRKYGYVLDKADTTCLSVQASSIEEAKESFKSLFSTDVTFQEEGNTVRVELKDQEDKPQGTVTFEPLTDSADGAIAHVTFNTTPAMLYVSELRYLVSWPDNAFSFSPFSLGEAVKKPVKKAYEKGEKNWVCLREATPQHHGLLVYISNDRFQPKEPVYKNEPLSEFADYNDAKTVSDIMKSDWDRYNQILKDAGLPYNRDFSVWYGDWDWYPFVNYWHWIRLKTGDTGKNEVAWGNAKREYMLVERFGMVTLE